MSLPYRYREFGVFRFFLAVCVLAQHLVVNAAPMGRIYATVPPYEIGSLSVLVFFCLSGFVITEAATVLYADKAFAYLTNRFLRIVPHFLIAVIIGISIHWIFFHVGTLRLSDRAHPELVTVDMFDWLNLVVNLFAFLPGTRRLMSYDFVGVIWAVRIEMVFYLTVFLCLVLPSRRRPQLKQAAPLIVVGLALLMLLVSRQFGFFFFFLYGVLLYDWRAHRTALVGCVAGMTLFFWLIPVDGGADYTRAVLPQYLLLVAFTGIMTWLALRSGTYRRIDQRCGDLTYPLYVNHENIIVLTLSITAGYHYSTLVVGFLMSLLVSYCLMRLVDPMVNRVRDVIRGRRLTRPVVTALPMSTTAKVKISG